MATCILANWWLGGEEDIPGQECSLGQEMLVPKVFYLPLGPHQCWWKVTKQWRKKLRRENGERPFFYMRDVVGAIRNKSEQGLIYGGGGVVRQGSHTLGFL